MKLVAVNRIYHLFIGENLVLLITFLWLYFPVISKMISEWYNDSNHSHGFIIPLIAGYFIWQLRKNLKNLILRPTNWGIIVLICGLVIYVLGNWGAAYTTMRVSMFVVLAGIILSIYGKEYFKTLRFPFFYLFLMIPIPSYIYDTIAFPLKLFVTKYSVLFMQLIGIIAVRQGNLIMLENTSLQVVDACSGIRSLTTLLAISIALAYVSQKTIFRKIILVFATVPIAILTNSTRIVITGILAQSYGSEAAEGFSHEFAGLGIFLLSVVLLIVTEMLLSKTKKNKKD